MNGKRIGMLVVTGRDTHPDDNNDARWVCKCDCGSIVSVRGCHLRSGKIKSCGCRRYKHRKSQTKEYNSWKGARNRVTNPSTPHWNCYGGRGITMCERWLDSFEHFLEDMGECPPDKNSIDRIDNNGNYEPGNCRWADSEEQQQNRRSTVFINHEGNKISMTEYCKLVGVNYRRFTYLFRQLGLSVEESTDSSVF